MPDMLSREELADLRTTVAGWPEHGLDVRDDVIRRLLAHIDALTAAHEEEIAQLETRLQRCEEAPYG